MFWPIPDGACITAIAEQSDFVDDSYLRTALSTKRHVQMLDEVELSTRNTTISTIKASNDES